MARIFFSYSHEDEQYRDQLEKHLAALKHQGLIESWHDRRILAGDNFDSEIDRQLDTADVVLLLVSSSFLSSRYCYGIEMKRALELHNAGKARVIPVIVRPCDWQNTPLGRLLAVPSDGKPITTWGNFDEAYTDIAHRVREIVQTMSDHHKAHSSAVRVSSPALPMPAVQSPRRSSNMRLRKSFSEADKDKYLHDSFDFLAHFFQESLEELQKRHPDVECRYRRLHANAFAATIYRGGNKEGECLIGLGGGFRQDGITYSRDVSSHGNSFNEMLSIEHDDQMLFLKPMGMSFKRSQDDKLSMEQAAEYYWEMLIASMQ